MNMRSMSVVAHQVESPMREIGHQDQLVDKKGLRVKGNSELTRISGSPGPSTEIEGPAPRSWTWEGLRMRSPNSM